MEKKYLKSTIVLSILLVIFMLAGCPVTPTEVTLTMKAPEGEGEVNPSVGEHTVLKGDEVTFTATPAEHWDFSKWIIGEEEVTDNPKTMEIKEDTEVQAVFVKETYELEITETGEGTVTADPEEGYTYGTEVELTAEPAEGWEFDKWVVDGEEKTDNPLTITIEGDTEVEAIFVEEAEEYTLTMLEPDGEGSTSPTSPGTYTYEEGTEVELTATADEGWDFDKWEIDGTEETDNPLTVTMDADKEAKAYFERKEYTLTMEIAQGEGEVVPAEGEHNYLFEDEVTLRATPATGYSFLKWMVNGAEETENPATVTIEGDTEVEAYFESTEPPNIILEKTSGDLMIIEAPCTAPINGLVFRYKLDDSKEAITSAKWKVTNPKGEKVYEEEIPESKYYYTWTINITEELLGEEPLGGQYTLTVEAENEFGLSAKEEVVFFVHVDEADVINFEFTEGILTVPEEERTHMVFYNASKATLEATISLDSKVRILVIAYKDHDEYGEDDFDCSDPENICLLNEVIIRETLSEKKETFTLDLEGLNDEYNRVRIILFNPLCGTMPCSLCPDFVDYGKLIWEEEISVECLPYECDKCDPCWPGYYNPGLKIYGLLENNESFIKDISLTVDGKEVSDIEITEKTDHLEARAKIKESDFPDLEGSYDFSWSVTTLTGQTETITCNGDFDFVEPEIEITPYGAPCGEATITVEFVFSDGMGLEDIEIWFDNATVLDFDKSYIESGGVYSFNPDGAKTYTLTATVTSDAVEGSELVIYGWAEDIHCNTNEASDSSAIDVKPPDLEFGIDCDYYEKHYGECRVPCDATEVILKWVVEDETFDYAEIEVNYGEIVGSPIIETKDGTILWELGVVNGDDIVATMTAYDLCGNAVIKSYKERICNVCGAEGFCGEDRFWINEP